ncbi:PAS domain S-box protein [Halobacterium sp. CBA1126]|uniref:hybrid sensor histidine kinase/response regulator n=1 Tax=Halobacterium TaxID=2239 RepID=UPI0012FBDFB5|nr:PAS domain S-box protein [Halobacterium sp. CBA1126]MUV60340.1 PAS domain S-box protein [Halobacterium sp. CBA1126]
MDAGTTGADEPIRVLHVDDDESFGELAGTYLERVDDAIDVATVTTTTAALDRLDDADCVVSDYDMPAQNGIEFLETVRERYPDLPFVLFTGKGSEEIASEAISAGVTDYLQKEAGTEQYTVLANRVRNAVERRRSERALAERNRRLSTLISNLPGMVYRCRNEPEWPMEFVGGECERLTGHTADALEAGDVVWGDDVIHPEDSGEMWPTVQAAIDGGEPFEVTYRIRTRNGNTKHVWERGRGITDADGDLHAIEGFITDVTQQRERRRRLERASERFEALFEHSPDMVNIHDAEGTIVDANQRFCEELGYSPEALVGKSVWDVDTTTDREAVLAMEAGMDRGDLRRFEAEFERADGSTFPVEVHLTQLEVGGERQFLAISRDVSAREEREAELRRLKRQYETVFENAQDGLVLLEVREDGDDVEFVYRQLNPAHEAMSGLDADELRGQTEAEAFDESLRGQTAAYHRECYERREPVEFEETFEFPAGDVVVSGTISPVVVDGEVTHLVAVTRDVTEFKERERALRRERDRLDEFADILSHDLRNPLNVATGNLEVAREHRDSDRLEAVADAHDRMRTLVDDVLTLAPQGRTATDLDSIALDPAAERAWATVETEDASLVAESSLTVRADDGRLGRLLENLFRNSVEHGGSDATVRVGALEDADGFYVADDGPGISEGDRERVFEYGYSTAAGGTGLGLSIVAELADAHGWDVAVTGSDAGGARFDVKGVELVE